MSTHDRILIILTSLTLIAWWISLVSYAQTEWKVAVPISTSNTIRYIGSGRQDDVNIHTLLDSNSFLTNYIDTMSQTGVSEADKQYDLISDDSLQRYVSRQQSFSDKHYIPSNLVTLDHTHLIIQWKKLQLKKDAADTLYALAGEFHEIFGKKLVIVSAYRSYSYQKNLKSKGCSDTLCAPAGHSEHQGGLAIDLFAATNAGSFLSRADFKKYYARLSDNAHRYGRHNTYQKWVKIDTYQPEPRHWRYVGRDLATELYEQKMTLGEWVKKQASLPQQ